MQELDINSIVSIEQMPKVFYELEQVGSYLDTELEKCRALDVSEESKSEVKKVRSNINKLLQDFEDKRKSIKKQLLEPYEMFNTKYEEEIKNKLTSASEELNMKIGQIEAEQIYEKEVEIRSFISEHIKANHLESIITIDDVITYALLKINLSTSLKSLKDKSLEFIEQVKEKTQLIKEEMCPNELLYEYKNNGFNLTKAKLTLLQRQKEIVELEKAKEVTDDIELKEKVQEDFIDTITMPKEVIDDEELLECTFKVKTTKENLKKIKEFLVELGVKYE